MESEARRLGSRPPVLIDRLLHFVLPSASREAVLGDLWERYDSPLQYASEGLRTVPYVVASRARRTSSVAIVGLQLFILAACLGVFSRDPGTAAVPFWASGALPAAAALIGLVLRNVYRGDESPLRRGLLDAATAAVSVLIAQAVLAGLVAAGTIDPAWLLPPALYILALLALPILAVLGAVETPQEAARWGRRAAAGGAALQESYAEFERRVRVRNRAEIVALGAIIGITAFILWRFDPAGERIGWVFVALYGAVVAYLAVRGRAAPMTPEMDPAESAALYRGELQRQHRLRRVMWWLWLLPLFEGLVNNVMRLGIDQGQPQRTAAGAVAFVLLAYFIVRLNAERGIGVRHSIDALTAAGRPAPSAA